MFQYCKYLISVWVEFSVLIGNLCDELVIYLHFKLLNALETDCVEFWERTYQISTSMLILGDLNHLVRVLIKWFRFLVLILLLYHISLLMSWKWCLFVNLRYHTISLVLNRFYGIYSFGNYLKKAKNQTGRQRWKLQRKFVLNILHLDFSINFSTTFLHSFWKYTLFDNYF